MANLIFWPAADVICILLPITFRARYADVQSIIDCFEVPIQKPEDPMIQAMTWSSYKQKNTLKFLISATPNGFINFVSGAFGGRISDKEMVIKSGYLQALPEGAKVMADRGFKGVSTVIAQKNKCALIRSPSVNHGVALTKEESREGKNIAALRVHIERAIRRIREFCMLGDSAKIHHSLMPYMNHVVIVAAGIAATQGPLLKK